MILGIDTSAALTSIAVIDATGDVLVTREHEDARRHAEVIGPMLAEVVSSIDRQGLEAVACGVGPGPYTGLRVGIAVAIAMGAAWDVPVHGLCSLDAIARQEAASTPGSALEVASDARRQEVYWAQYDADGRRVAGPRVRLAADVAASVPRGMAHGMWVARRVQELLRAGVQPSSVDIALDAHGADTGATEAALAGAQLLPPRPLYLRRPDAMVPVGLQERA